MKKFGLILLLVCASFTWEVLVGPAVLETARAAEPFTTRMWYEVNAIVSSQLPYEGYCDVNADDERLCKK